MDLFWRGGGSPPAEHIRHDDLTARGEKNLSDTEIYARDIRGLNESDAIIAEASAPSLGVGYELGRAEAAGKPILCLFDASGNARLSAMLSGNPAVKVVCYQSLDEAQAAIDVFIASR